MSKWLNFSEAVPSDASNRFLPEGIKGRSNTHFSRTRSKTMAKTKQQPAHEIRMGAIKATIWENQTQTGTRHNVTVSRIYKDSDEWKQTESFGRDDLPLLAKVVDLAHTWIFELGA